MENEVTISAKVAFWQQQWRQYGGDGDSTGKCDGGGGGCGGGGSGGESGGGVVAISAVAALAASAEVAVVTVVVNWSRTQNSIRWQSQ